MRANATSHKYVNGNVKGVTICRRHMCTAPLWERVTQKLGRVSSNNDLGNVRRVRDLIKIAFMGIGDI